MWDGKPDKIARSTIYQSWTDGGLGFPNTFIFLKSLRIKWVKMICSRLKFDINHPQWMSLANYIVNRSKCIYWPYFGLEKLKTLNIKNKFWLEIVDLLKDINEHFKITNWVKSKLFLKLSRQIRISKSNPSEELFVGVFSYNK